MRTMKDLCQEALDVQDACNLSGVVHSFSRTITELRTLVEQEPGFSTDKLNRHPVCVMFSSKIASLTGSEGYTNFKEAYAFCQQQAAK